MIVKKNKVIVIDKKDQDKYMKQGWELAEEVGLNEGTIDEGVFDPKDGEKWAKEIQKGIKAPVVDVKTSSLGGEESMSIMVKFSMEKEASKGGTAFFNSRYANVRVDIDGSMEMFQASHKFGIKKMRKAKIKSTKDVIKKINDWIVKVPSLKEEVDLDEFTKKDFDSNEDQNMHTENAVELARKFGTSKEYDQMVAIYKAHMKKGEISRSDQMKRDALVKKYLPKLKEEVDLDEAKSDFEVKYAKSKGGPIKVTKFVQYDQARKFLHNLKKDGMNGIISKDGKPVKEEVDLDEVDRSTYSDRIKRFTGFLKDAEKEKPLDKEWIKLLKRRIEKENDDLRKELKRSTRATTRKELGFNREEVDLDEVSPNKMKVDVIVMKRDNSEKSVVGASGVKRAEKDGWKIQYALLAPYGKKVTDPKGIMKAIKGGDKLGIGEEVEIDEGKMNNATMQADSPRIKKAKKHIDDLEFERKRMTTSGQESLDKLIKAKSIKDARKAFDDMYGYEYDRVTSSGQESMVKIGKMLGIKMEEVDLDEGKMSQLHQYIKDKKSAEEIAKLMGLDVKTIKALMSSHHPEDVEEGAAADARRAMSRDKDFSRKDSADDDTDASADDVKGASKNIMMQMRKAQSLNGRFAVEFGDGKKVKIPAKMAIAVQQKYKAMKRPAEKEKFQAKIGKSYKDMLSALKEELQPKKESILERINRKIKENKDG
jgi:hypothetical protein